MNQAEAIITSIIVPAYNEEEVLFSQLESFIATWDKSKFGSFELIIVENGSRDQTWREVRRLSKKYDEVVGIHIVRSSYGMALKRGLLAARGKFILCIDVDYYDFVYINASMRWLHHTHGFVVGSKLHPESIDSRGVGRLLTTRLLNKIIRLFFNYPGTDTHGLKSFYNNSLFRTCVRRCVCRDELFDTELLIRLEREGAHWTEMPVFVREIRNSRSSLFKRSRRAFCDFCRIALSSLIGGLAVKGTLPLVADDYGWSRDHDKIIRANLNLEKDMTVSVLANMVSSSSLKKLITLASSQPIIISLHFNLVEGKPLSDPKVVSTLINCEGEFHSLPCFYLRLICGLISLNEIRIEFAAQFRRLNSYITVAHLDSHQHTHLLIPIQQVIFRTKIQSTIAVRSAWSSMNYLARKPIRCIGLVIMRFVRTTFYERLLPIRKTGSIQHQDELVIHPGFSYDD